MQSGAVALLLSAERMGARARVGDLTLLRGPLAVGPSPAGHLALLPLVGNVPRVLASASPPNMSARVALDPL
jgi:hypothetical protein